MTKFDPLNAAIKHLRSYSSEVGNPDQYTPEDHAMAAASVLHALAMNTGALNEEVSPGGRAFAGMMGEGHIGHPVHDFIRNTHAGASEAMRPHLEGLHAAAMGHFNTLKTHAANFSGAAASHFSNIHSQIKEHLGPSLQHHFGNAHAAIATHLATLHTHASHVHSNMSQAWKSENHQKYLHRVHHVLSTISPEYRMAHTLGGAARSVGSAAARGVSRKIGEVRKTASQRESNVY
jgi:hypothetical protein